MQHPAHIHLVLYVAGDSLRSVGAVNAVRSLLADRSPSDYTIDIVDVLEEPEIAERDRVIATPTIARLHPEPRVRILGDPDDGAAMERLRALLVSETSFPAAHHKGLL